jgi:hypothetical protein
MDGKVPNSTIKLKLKNVQHRIDVLNYFKHILHSKSSLNMFVEATKWVLEFGSGI